VSGFLNKIRDINRNHIVFYVFTIYLLITYILLAFLILSGLDYKDYILRDDGYYFMAKNFGKGIFNSGSVIGPGLPFIYAPIHFFNENLHPFIRLSISHIAVLIILFTVSKLTITYLNDRQLFWGLLMVIIHPVFIQWTFRTSVDLYLSLFLGVFILYLIKYIDKGRIINLFFSFLAYSYAIFIRPSFICIPLVLLLSSLVILKSRKIILISFALLITTGVCFYANNIYLLKNSGSKKITADSGRSFVILQSFVLTETILKTKQFHKGDVDNYNVEDSLSGARYIYKNVNEYIANYNNKYPNGSPVHMVLKYILFLFIFKRDSLIFIVIVFYCIFCIGLDQPKTASGRYRKQTVFCYTLFRIVRLFPASLDNSCIQQVFINNFTLFICMDRSSCNNYYKKN